MTFARAGVPDLLRRFAPTPFGAMIGAGNVALRVETNDLAIISELQKAGVQPSHGDSSGLLFLKIIRDKDATSEGRAVTVLSAYPLITMQVGFGTMIVLDCERREALGFLAPEVTAEEFAGILFPFICDLLANSSYAAEII